MGFGRTNLAPAPKDSRNVSNVFSGAEHRDNGIVAWLSVPELVGKLQTIRPGQAHKDNVESLLFGLLPGLPAITERHDGVT